MNQVFSLGLLLFFFFLKERYFKGRQVLVSASPGRSLRKSAESSRAGVCFSRLVGASPHLTWTGTDVQAGGHQLDSA